MGIVEMLVERGIERGMKAIHDDAIRKEYEKGFEIGIKKVKARFIKKLLTANKYTDAEIANWAEVTEAFVRKEKKSLK